MGDLVSAFGTGGGDYQDPAAGLVKMMADKERAKLAAMKAEREARIKRKRDKARGERKRKNKRKKKH